MALYIIGDLHLSFSKNKPMSIFGDVWKNHEEKIKESWKKNVKKDDIVILAGDFSWATYIDEAYEDFKYINCLPGKKIFLKGNHDYWWETVTKMKKFLEEKKISNIEFLYNNVYEYGNYIISGAKGYSSQENEKDIKIYNRELLRLEISLQKAKEIKEKSENLKKINTI